MVLERLLRVLLLEDYNTRVVMFGTVMLGVAGGVVGVFLLLRRRSLLADAVSHAALPGVAIAFIVSLQMGGTGRSLPVLLLGALLAGLTGMGCVLGITRFTRLSQDAALGIVLSVFFGFGTALLGIIQKMRGAPAAGLNSFIYGKTASMIRSDAILIGVAAVAILVLTVLLFKEFRLITFDGNFAAGDGWPVQRLDFLLMSLAVVVTVLGLQAVGVVLVVAILIIPAVSARFWTDRLRGMVLISAGIGAAGGYLGTAISGLAPRLPAGAIIVAVLGSFFALSLLFGARSGLVRRFLEQRELSRRVRQQNLLRALCEWDETQQEGLSSDQSGYLLTTREWHGRELKRGMKELTRRGLVYRLGQGPWLLTSSGRTAANRVTRNHRLWEAYLLTYADTATAHVDHGADFIEHVLGEELVAELEASMPQFGRVVPQSVHALSHSGDE